MIFLAVGTQFGFDRLVRAVDEAIEKGLIHDEVFAQIGPGSYNPHNMDYVVNLNKDDFDKTFHSCRAMISHAGMGNIALAIKTGKPLLVMPRLKQYAEVVNNHQVDTARKFEALGHLLAANDEAELPDKIKQLDSFIPKPRTANREGIINRMREFIDQLADNRK